MKRTVILTLTLMLLLTACGGTDTLRKAEVTVIDTNTLKTVGLFPLTIHRSDFAGTCGGSLLADTTFEYYQGSLDTALSGNEPEWEYFNPKTEEGSA